MTSNIFEKILFGIKVANDNIVVLNEKVDELMHALHFEDAESTEPNEHPGSTIQ